MHQVIGGGSYTVYSSDGALFESGSLSYELGKSGTHFGIRAIFRQPKQEKRMFVVSDYKDIYQSEQILQSDASVQVRHHAWGTFSNGIMPKRMGLGGWALPEALALCIHLYPIRERQDVFPTSLVPEIVKARAINRGHELIAPTLTMNDPSTLLVSFPARVRIGGRLMGVAPLAEVEASYGASGLPVRMSLRIHSPRVDETGRVATSLLSEFTIQGEEQRNNDADFFRGVAHDGNVGTVVNDRRKGRTASYALEPNDEVPFGGTKKAIELDGAILARTGAERHVQGKRAVVMGGMAALLAAGICYAIAMCYRKPSPAERTPNNK